MINSTLISNVFLSTMLFLSFINQYPISDWPADAGGSETLMKVLDKLDSECALRCERWDMEDNLKFALMWVRYKFR